MKSHIFLRELGWSLATTLPVNDKGPIYMDPTQLCVILKENKKKLLVNSKPAGQCFFPGMHAFDKKVVLPAAYSIILKLYVKLQNHTTATHSINLN